VEQKWRAEKSEAAEVPQENKRAEVKQNERAEK